MVKRVKVVPHGWPCTFDECPPGLFATVDIRTGDVSLGLMTEYTQDRPDGSERQRDAYVVDSGEYWWGGTSTVAERGKVIVQPCVTETSDEDE